MSSVGISPARQALERPVTVLWAVVIIAGCNVLSIVASFLPLKGNDDIPVAAIVVGTAFSLFTVAVCWWLWRCKRWAAIVVTVVGILNMLTALPGLGDPPSGTIEIIILASIPLTLLPLWLVWHPESRSAYALS